MKAKTKNYMWYKVKELSNKGFKNSQISRQLELDRATVRKYLLMSEQEFHSYMENPKHLPLKLSGYLNFVKTELNKFPDLSSAQIEDRLKENFVDLPEIHSKTVFNFVLMVRRKYGIEKPAKENLRQFEKLLDMAYGLQAQVDFGEFNMQTNKESRQKIYFFCIVLSRSRYKFVHFENKPFTSKTAVESHILAFEYYGGVPKEILYDQDKVFIHNENLGDYLLTHEFQSFCQTQSFKTVFCKKADPQSKGKIENVVKYVKYNFLRGRIFTNVTDLNKLVKSWLDRTANGKVHGATQKIPINEWTEEKNHLLPLKNQEIKILYELHQYNVRKDNTVAYKGNFYSLPLGTYCGAETKIDVEIKDEILNFYNAEKQLITSHKISVIKGETIRNTDHCRDKSKSQDKTNNDVLTLLGNTEKAHIFLELLHADKPRYYHDNLRAIKQGIDLFPKDIIEQTLQICLENKVYNGKIFSDIACNFMQQNKKSEILKIDKQISVNKTDNLKNKISEIPQTSNINVYTEIF